ncbi:MAG: tetratricopeptide repeat protein [Legionellales bacterium]|nr:tetratricopeptide repeat protein [Legionellales bacterium]
MSLKNIQFTRTEKIILGCFSNQINSHKALAKALAISEKSIRTHITNVKNKTKSQDKEGISKFLDTLTKQEVNELRKIFEQYFISEQYNIIAKQIFKALSKLNIYCACSIFCDKQEPGVDYISNAIKALGVNLHTRKISKNYPRTKKSLKKNDFCLHISKNAEQLDKLNDNRAIFICLGEKQQGLDNILFYNPDNLIEFYHHIIKFLINRYPQVKKLNRNDNLLKYITFFKNSPIYKEVIELQKQEIPQVKKPNNSWGTIIIASIIGISAILATYIGFFPAKQPTVEISRETLVYNLPHKNRNFTGREDIIKQIKENLNTTNIDMAIQVIAGVGGVGKSELLTEYTYRALETNQYQAILWINAHTKDSLDNSYIDIAKNLGIDTANKNQEVIKRLVHQSLHTKHNVNSVLIVLDNAPNEQSVQQYIANLHQQWSFDTNIDILISTRHKDWNANTFILDIFSPIEAKQFVKKQLPNESNEDITKLITLVKHYPLALKQAVAYITQNTNINDYINLYNTKNQKEDNQPIQQTLDISLSNIEDGAKDILFISAYLKSININTKFFDYLPIDKKLIAIDQLAKYSLITANKNKKSFKIHEFLQEILRNKSKDNTWLNKTINLAKQFFAKFDKSKPSTWSKAKSFLSHINVLAKYAPPDITTATLLDNYAVVARYFGQYDLAYELLIQSLNIQESLYKNKEDIKLVNILNHLAQLELKLGNYPNTNFLYKKILKIKQSHYKDNKNINLADTLNNLARTESALGNYIKSKSLYLQALDIQTNHYKDENNINIANTLSGLGAMELKLGSFEESKKLFQKALVIKQKIISDSNNPNLYGVMSSAGVLELYVGNHAIARALLTEALDILKHNNPDDFLSTVWPYQNLAVLEWSLGNFTKAKQLFLKTLKINQDHYNNPSHISTGIIYQGLGLVEFSMGNYLEAIQWLEKDLTIREFYYKSHNHLSLGSPLYTLALSHEQLANYKIALSKIEKTYSILRPHFKDHLPQAMSQDYTPAIAWPTIITKNKNEAIRYYQQALEFAKKIFGDDNHFVARYHYLLGQAYEINNNTKQALIQYQKALILAEQVEATITNKDILIKFQQNINLVKLKLADSSNEK